MAHPPTPFHMVRKLRGQIGPTGPTGPQGLPGDPGAVGPTGPAGNRGADGNQGAMGSPGTQGLSGPQGVPGPAGAVGPVGPTGPTGVSTPVQIVSVVQDFGRVQGGATIRVVVECPVGTKVVGGGAVADIIGGNVTDANRIHQLFSGPVSDVEWVTASTAVNTLSQGANLRYTASASCVGE